MGTKVVSFENMTFGQLFAFIKKEGLALCPELKIQMKYGSERKEVGTFCETIRIKGIKSPSSLNKKNLKKWKRYIKYKNPKNKRSKGKY